ncbi:MAG: 2-amino-4-hydroxy-6-hydroxymethyldihydropteridine diphosphokinase [Rikenellaceae bacterium]
MRRVVLLLGSNLGAREELLDGARRHIETCVGEIVGGSYELETEAVGYASSGIYLNQVVVCHTLLTPIGVLDAVQSIERAMGRVGRTSRSEEYSDRTIDIDLLHYYEDECIVRETVMTTQRLILPHPEIPNRPFVGELLGAIVYFNDKL